MAATYKDLNLTFEPHPGTKDCIKLNDVDAVKASLKNIIFSGPFDSPFNPSYGASFRRILFELSSPSLFALAKRQLIIMITEYEPRCVIEDIYLNDNNEYTLDLGILFHVVGNPLAQTLNYTLERTR